MTTIVTEATIRRPLAEVYAFVTTPQHWLQWHPSSLGLSEEVRDGLYQTFERWDGKGVPREARGDEIRMPARIVNLADVVEVFHQAGGVDAAVTVARERRGTQFDPAVVDDLVAVATRDSRAA